MPAMRQCITGGLGTASGTPLIKGLSAAALLLPHMYTPPALRLMCNQHLPRVPCIPVSQLPKQLLQLPGMSHVFVYGMHQL